MALTNGRSQAQFLPWQNMNPSRNECSNEALQALCSGPYATHTWGIHGDSQCFVYVSSNQAKSGKHVHNYYILLCSLQKKKNICKLWGPLGIPNNKKMFGIILHKPHICTMGCNENIAPPNRFIVLSPIVTFKKWGAMAATFKHTHLSSYLIRFHPKKLELGGSQSFQLFIYLVVSTPLKIFVRLDHHPN